MYSKNSSSKSPNPALGIVLKSLILFNQYWVIIPLPSLSKSFPLLSILNILYIAASMLRVLHLLALSIACTSGLGPLLAYLFLIFPDLVNLSVSLTIPPAFFKLKSEEY